MINNNMKLADILQERTDLKSRMDRAKEMGFDIDAYHGTTRDIDQFDSSKHGNVGGHYGAHNYFTSSTDDLENYSGEGPDLTNRIEQEADHYYGGDNDDVIQDWLDAKGKDIQVDDLTDDQREKIVRKIAKASLGMENKGVSMPVKLKGKKLVNVDVDTETHLDFDEALSIMRDTLYQYDVADREIDNVMSHFDDWYGDETITATDFEEAIRDAEFYAYDHQGEMLSPGAVIADVYAEMGYDGVKMNAEKSFGRKRSPYGMALPGMDGVYGAYHYIVFDGKNVRSQNAMFDPDKKDSKKLMDWFIRD
jgi:hypothetical protein